MCFRSNTGLICYHLFDRNEGEKNYQTQMFLFLQFRIEKIVKEKEELLKVTSVLEKETAQLRDQVERLEKELNHEKQRCDQLQTEQKVSCLTD